MKISEIFYSIAGEAKGVGEPTVFVRLAKCNLNCVFFHFSSSTSSYIKYATSLPGFERSSRINLARIP